MIVKVKKLYNGFASVRDYIVRDCAARGEDLTIVLNGVEKVVPLERLKNPFQLTKTKIKSKIGGDDYELIDFKWESQEPLRQERLI